MTDVFISYSRKDYVDEHKNVIPGNVVSKVIDALTTAGITYWFDEEGIYSGDNFTEKIVRSIEDSQLFLFISTANANSSHWTSKEIATADELGKKIIPLRIDRSPYERSVIFRIANLSYIDYFQNPEKGLNDLVSSIRAYLKQVQEEAERIEEEEERRREAERKRAEEERKRIEQEQQNLISDIKIACAAMNNEEAKLEIDRSNLLLKVERVADKEQRESLRKAINEGGAIHLKYQREQSSMIQKIQDYDTLINKLQCQIKDSYEKANEPLREIQEKERLISQLQTELKEAKALNEELKSEAREKQDKKEQQEPHITELKKWNWGAFFFSWIWGLHNKVYWQSLVVLVFWIILFFQSIATLMFKYYRTKWVLNNSLLKSMNELNPWIFPIIIIILSLVLGFFGTRWAWQAKKWDSWKLFQIAQRRWTKAVIWAIPIVLMLFIIAQYGMKP